LGRHRILCHGASWGIIPEEYYPGRLETKQAFRRVEDALRQFQKNSDLGVLRDLYRLALRSARRSTIG
jgi:hypothetical protein